MTFMETEQGDGLMLLLAFAVCFLLASVVLLCVAQVLRYRRLKLLVRMQQASKQELLPVWVEGLENELEQLGKH